VRLIRIAALAALLAFVSTVPAEADSCQWQLSVAPDVVRSPIQMDIHAAYRIFVFQSDGSVGYRLHGEFPFAAFLSLTTYNAADRFVYGRCSIIRCSQTKTRSIHSPQVSWSMLRIAPTQ
jgi:hypothetical protein